MHVVFDGRTFRTERQKRHISQARLAEQVDSTVRYMRDLEKGKKCNPSAALVYQFSVALGVPMEKLMIVLKGDE